MNKPTGNAALDLFLARHQSLSGLPENNTRIVQMANDSECNVFQLLKLISHDAGLVANIIQTLNSAYYALPNKITQLDRAVAYLGLRTVKDLALAASVASLFKGVHLGKYQARDLWNHSVAVALVARDLAKQTKVVDVEEAFLAGILHDIGLLFEVQSEPKTAVIVFAAVEKTQASFIDAERAAFGFNHAEAGAAIAAQWEFPQTIRHAIQFHHQPELADDESRKMCAVIAIADRMVCQAAIGYPETCRGQTVTDELLEVAGIPRTTIEAIQADLPRLLTAAISAAA